MKRDDLRWIAIFLVLGLAGLTTFLHLYPRAFPTASLDFRFSPDEVDERARSFVDSVGLDPAGYNSARIFRHDYMGQVFLERTIGLGRANELARDWLSIWQWSVRYYRPLEKEELHVDIDPGGRIVGFRHLILESDPGDSLGEEGARTIAERFLTNRVGVDLGRYEPIEHSSQQRPERLDHTFTYRRSGFTAGDDGHYRVQVVVHGSSIGAFNEFIYVPESFRRHHDDVRSQAALLSQVAGIGWFALIVIMLIVLVQRYRQGQLRWRTPVIVGVAVGATVLAAALNSLPLSLFGYETTKSFGSFLTLTVVFAVFGALLTGGLISLAGCSGAAAERLLPEPAVRRIGLGAMTWRRLFAPTFSRTVLIGYGMAFVMAGYVASFYMVGTEYLGVWAPADVDQYDDSFSTWIPWINPLLIGLSAATMEEFFFRMLAISVLVRWLGRRWLAILIPAVVWAFLHSDYPIEPIYSRGVELTVIGCVFGWIYLRFGIWTTVVAHYGYNAFLTALPMIKSTSTYFQVSGVLVIGVLALPLVPVAIGWITGWRPAGADEETAADEGDAEVDEGGAAAVDQAAEAVASSEAAAIARHGELRPGQREVVAYRPDRGRLYGIAAVGVVGLALYVALDVPRFGESLKLETTRWEAAAAGEQFITALGFDVGDHLTSSQFSSNLGSDHFTHLIRAVGIERADSLAAVRTHPWRWWLRWFRDQEKEEFSVEVGPAGDVVAFNHLVADSASGPQWSTDSARVAVEVFVSDRFGLELADSSSYRLLEETEDRLEARLDHNFVWETTAEKIEEGEFRTVARVQGDEPAGLDVLYKAPEEFLRELDESDLLDSVALVVIGILVLTSLIAAGVFFFRCYREGAITWSEGVRWGIVVAATSLAQELNELPGFFAGYDTTRSLVTHLAGDLLGKLVTLAALAGLTAVMVALCLALCRQLYPEQLDPAQWLHLFWRGRVDPLTAALSVLVALCGAVAIAGIDQLDAYARYTWLAEHLEAGGPSPPAVNTYLPVVAVLSGVARLPLILFGGLAMLLIWRRLLGRGWAVAVLLAFVSIAAATIGPAESPGHFAWLFGLQLLSVAAILGLAVCVARFNLLVYFALFWFNMTVSDGRVLLETGHLFLQANGIAIIAIGLVPLALPLLARRRAASGS